MMEAEARNTKILFFFFFILLLCNTLYDLLPFPPILYRGVLVLLYLFLLAKRFFFIRADGFERGILFFVILNVCYYVISLSYADISFGSIGNILCAMLPFLALPYFGEKNFFTEKGMAAILLFLTCACVHYNVNATISFRETRDFYDGEFTNNASNLFAFLLPLLFCVKKTWVSFLCFAVCVFYLITGYKRGTIIASMLPMLLYIIMLFRSNRKKKWTLVILLVLCGVLFVEMRDFIENDSFFNSRVEDTMEGKSSGRDIIYMTYLRGWFESDNVLRMLFGYGFRGTTQYLLHRPAHSDWVQMLFDYGIVGCLFYSYVLVSLLKKCRQAKSPLSRMILFSIFFIWSVKSIVSMAYDEQFFVFMAMAYAWAKQGEKTYCRSCSVV